MSAADTAMPVRVLDWKREIKGSRIGFVSIILGQSLQFNELPVNCSNGLIWVGLPSKPLTRGLEVLADDKGRPRWAKVVQWTSRHASDRFTASVLAAIRAAHGDAALEPPA